VKDVRRRVMSEIFLAPSVVLPLVAGATSWLLSWGAGGNSWLNLAGLVSTVGAIGWMATRWIFQVENITEQVMEDLRLQEIENQNKELDQLAQFLLKDRDHRTEDYLILLRAIKGRFDESRIKSKSSVRFMEFSGRVDELFRATIGQLKRTYQLYEMSRDISPDTRKSILQQREGVLNEIKASIEHLETAVSHFTSMLEKNSTGDLSTLRDELDTSLRVAQRTEERLKEMEGSGNWNAVTREMQ
jgi:hypothetical protein